MDTLSNSLRPLRRQAGLSQADLATRASISRQAYSAIELGSSTPSTDVALRLAHALGASVEALFALPGAALPGQATLTAPLVEGPEAQRADVHQIGERWIARPLAGAPGRPAIVRSLPVANALVHASDDGRAAVEPLLGATGRTLVAVGCDPSVSVVAAHLHARGVELSSYEMGSAAALRELAAGNAHVAGCHLLDPETGEYNLPAVARLLPFPATVITFAVWDQGLVVAPGNPKGIRGIEDLARPGIAIVNREPGSGSRMLLDEALAGAGVPVSLIAGYDRLAASHLSVAEAVGMGLADTGVAVRAAAIALGLDFVPLGQERYDLVFPNHFLNDEPVAELLASLRSASLQRQVEALGGYDVARMGVELPRPAVA
jgi:putative molybdopterin biosynthesis protein